MYIRVAVYEPNLKDKENLISGYGSKDAVSSDHRWLAEEPFLAIVLFC